MKQVKSKNENCIPVLTSCVEWNGGSIEYLGICDGDSLNLLLWEVVTKLQELAGEDLSTFDIDSLLDICNQKAPLEINLLSILTLLKDNQVCLKDFIDTLSERLNELFANTGVTVNLKCYAEFDNLGNSLSITRDQLDQLVIDQLCNHKQRIETLEGKIITLQQQVDDIDPTATVEELSFDTCLDPGVDKPTSTNVVDLADDHCALQTATGTPADFSTAYANNPTYPVEVTTNPNYIASPANFAEQYSNLLLFNQYLVGILAGVLDCCNASCDDIELGFTALYNEDGDGVVIVFNWGTGTTIPSVFEDCGSTVKITDKNGAFVVGNIEITDDTNEEFIVSGLDLSDDLQVEITARLCREGLTCQKCLTKTVSANTRCSLCTIENTGETGNIIIMYDGTFLLLPGDGEVET